MRRTKIVCTIGPATQNEETLSAMVQAGMNVARLNFSHGTHDYHQKSIDLVKKVRTELGCPLALMMDTRGPEIRIGTFAEERVTLQDDATFTLTTREVTGNRESVFVNYQRLPSLLHPGDLVLVDDGSIRLSVVSCSETDIITTVIRGGQLSARKGVNVPHVRLDMPYLSEQDKDDLLFGVKNDMDFVSASFVRSREDVVALRKFLNYHGGHDIHIISKIENSEGIENFDAILEESDGIMVARGDMGVEVDFERLPGLQKRFIKKCMQAGKIVITATQMLESMVNHAYPTRAEITDVANAVFDGTSAVMLSGETAAGKYPVEAVAVMAKIATQAESDAFGMDAYKGIKYENDCDDTTNAVCDAACTTARDINAKAIIAVTKSGTTAGRMAKFRPFETIVAATPVEKTFHQLSLSWGIYPVLALYQKTFDNLFIHAIDCARQIDIVHSGDTVVIAAGIPLDTPGNTNIMKIEVVK